VEHRLDIASKYADEICVMDNGRIVSQDSPSTIYGKKDTYLLGVGVPRVSLLFHLLKGKGFQIKKIPVTVEEARVHVEELKSDRS
jgi:energy-coupling factor transporter ATP-binding protein EcfA2